MSTTKPILEVSTNHKERVRKISEKADTSIKDATNAILQWALPKFEEGGDHQLEGVKAVKSKTQSEEEAA